MSKQEMESLTKSIGEQCKELKDDLLDQKKLKTKDDWKKMHYIKEGDDQENE